VITKTIDVKMDEELHQTFKQLEEVPPYKVVFQGNMSYYPNVKAAKYLAGLLTGKSEVRGRYCLYLVGGSPSSEVKALASDCVKVTGYVPKIEPYLARADIAIYPIMEATGVQTKVLEAMAAGVPCVVSSACVKGIPGIQHDVHCLVADSDEGIIDSVEKLINDPERHQRITSKAREFVNLNYSWEENINRLESLWKRL